MLQMNSFYQFYLDYVGCKGASQRWRLALTRMFYLDYVGCKEGGLMDGATLFGTSFISTMWDVKHRDTG